MKIHGYKVIKIHIDSTKVLCDIAVFGEDSLMIDNCQLCESILQKVPYEDRATVGSRYGKELSHNFINDMLVIH